MARDEKVEGMQKTILLLQEELERLKSPPYMSGTVLDVGKKMARISIDGAGIYEIPSDESLRGKVQRGSRVTLNPMTKSVIGNSEFASLSGEVAMVDEVLDDRLRVQNKGEYYIVLNSVEGVKPGDEVMLDPSKAVAVERFSRKRTRYALEQVPVAPWANIGGLEATIAKVRQEIEEPFLHREVFEKYGRKPAKGILLYGPPGCGKTMIAKSIAYNLAQVNRKMGATNTNGHFIRVNGPEILDKWVGNSEANIRRIYESAREAASENESPVVIFIDEAESVLKTRGSGVSTDVYDSIVPQFL
ncbi:MAG: AAA family ATPase, partial [Nanoarchaeota archaeon]